jgi:hypothetical protein
VCFAVILQSKLLYVYHDKVLVINFNWGASPRIGGSAKRGSADMSGFLESAEIC